MQNPSEKRRGLRSRFSTLHRQNLQVRKPQPAPTPESRTQGSLRTRHFHLHDLEVSNLSSLASPKFLLVWVRWAEVRREDEISRQSNTVQVWGGRSSLIQLPIAPTVKAICDLGALYRALHLSIPGQRWHYALHNPKLQHRHDGERALRRDEKIPNVRYVNRALAQVVTTTTLSLVPRSTQDYKPRKHTRTPRD